MSTDPEKASESAAPESGEKTVTDAKEAPANGAQEGAAGAAAGAPAEPGPEQKLAAAQAEAARLKDQLLRTAADFDNFRKRSRRAEDDAQRRGREQMLKDLLPVFDNLERAVQHAETSPEAQGVASGLRMVLKLFLDTLERAGIKRIPTVGHAFDPARHEAIQQLESKEHPAGMVIAEVQPGYTLGDSLVREAKVVVSRGAPAGETSPN
jgi:molecular chaperone GrpE